jgi:hypothetical protein
MRRTPSSGVDVVGPDAAPVLLLLLLPPPVRAALPLPSLELHPAKMSAERRTIADDEKAKRRIQLTSDK